MRILGISAFYHDSAAALLVDGKIVAAAQEERFTRKKHDPSFPAAAVRYCLAAANISAAELDHVVFYEKPFLKFERLLETYLAFAPRGFQSFRKAIPVWLKEKLFQKSVLRDHLAEIDDSVDWESEAAVCRSSPEPRGFRVLCFAVCESRDPDAGRRRRMDHDVGRLRPGQHARSQARDQLPALDRAALFGLHLLHRLQGQFRRVQGDGARALWRAEICAD